MGVALAVKGGVAVRLFKSCQACTTGLSAKVRITSDRFGVGWTVKAQNAKRNVSGRSFFNHGGHRGF